jgi:hypothetical protein
MHSGEDQMDMLGCSRSLRELHVGSADMSLRRHLRWLERPGACLFD